LFVYFLREVILRAGGGATGRGAVATAAALDPAGFHTRGGAAFNLGFFYQMQQHYCFVVI